MLASRQGKKHRIPLIQGKINLRFWSEKYKILERTWSEDGAALVRRWCDSFFDLPG